MKKIVLATLVLASSWFLQTPSVHTQVASSKQTSAHAGKGNQASIDQNVSLLTAGSPV